MYISSSKTIIRVLEEIVKILNIQNIFKNKNLCELIRFFFLLFVVFEGKIRDMILLFSGLYSISALNQYSFAFSSTLMDTVTNTCSYEFYLQPA